MSARGRLCGRGEINNRANFGTAAGPLASSGGQSWDHRVKFEGSGGAAGGGREGGLRSGPRGGGGVTAALPPPGHGRSHVGKRPRSPRRRGKGRAGHAGRTAVRGSSRPYCRPPAPRARRMRVAFYEAVRTVRVRVDRRRDGGCRFALGTKRAQRAERCAHRGAARSGPAALRPGPAPRPRAATWFAHGGNPPR